MNPSDSHRIGRWARYDSFKPFVADPSYHPYRHPTFTAMPNIPVAPPPLHRIISGDHHQQYWQAGDQQPPGNPFYIPSPPHRILPEIETHRMPRVSTRSLISDKLINGPCVGGSFLPENCELGRDVGSVNQVVSYRGSDRFPLCDDVRSFPSGDADRALVSWHSFEFEQDRFLRVSPEWRYQPRLGPRDTLENPFRNSSMEPLAFETASLAAEYPSVSSPRRLCSAGSVSCWGGDASTVFEPEIPPWSLRSSGHCVYGGDLAQDTDIIENSHVIGSSHGPQWLKPMRSKTSSAKNLPSDKGFQRRQYLGHRVVNKFDPMYISNEESIRRACNGQRKIPNLSSMVDDHGFDDDGSMNNRGKRKMVSDGDSKFLSRCAKQPIQKPSAFSRMQSSISVWERLEKKPSPCFSPSAVSSPRNSTENQTKVDMPNLPFKSDATVAKTLDASTAETSLIEKDISVVKTNRVVSKKKKKKKRRQKEVIPIIPGLLESCKKQVIHKASSLGSPTNDSMQSETLVKAATSYCLFGEKSVLGCCTKKVKTLAVVNKNEKEAIETVMQLDGGIAGTPVVEDELTVEEGTMNVKAKGYNHNVVLGSEPVDDNNLQLFQQEQMMQVSIANDVNMQNITVRVNPTQDFVTEILDDSVEDGLAVKQNLCSRYEHPVVSEVLVSENVCSQFSDSLVSLREMPVDNDGANDCSVNVGNADAANLIKQTKTEIDGTVTFAHCKLEEDRPLQEAASPKPLVCGDADVSVAFRTFDDLPDFNCAQRKTDRKVKQQHQMLVCTTIEPLGVLGVDVSSQSCVQVPQSHSASKISSSILKQDLSNEVNVEENNELHFSLCNLLPQSCCDVAFQENLVIDASAKRMGQFLALETRKMDSPCRHFENAKNQPKLSESSICGQEDQKDMDKEETLVSSMVSLGSKPDNQLGKSTGNNQLMFNKPQPLLSQELLKKVAPAKLANGSSLKSIPTQGMVPRFLPNSKIFTDSVKRAGNTSKIGRHRTWVRTTKPSSNLDAKSGGTSTKPVPEWLSKVQNSLYIRKGNSLIRKQDDATPMLLPAIDASSITLKSSTARSSVCECRLESIENAASSYLFVERPKTPPLPLSKFSGSSMNANNSFPLPKSLDERPELCLDQHDNQNKDLRSCNLETKDVEGSAGFETINPKRITYDRSKMNQLIVAPEPKVDESSKGSTETFQIPAQLSEERSKAIPISSSHVYYRRKRNQLILNASSSDNQQVGDPLGNLNFVDYFKQNNLLNSRIVIQKEKTAGKFSLVWMLGGVRRSQKIMGTLRRQGVLPFILPWKRPAKRKSFLITNGPVSRSSSLSLISQKLQHLRKRNTIYKVSTDGFSIQKAGVVSIGGSSLKWSKSIEKRSKKASEEATMAVAEVERKKRERKKSKGTCGNGKGLPCRSTSSSVLKQDDSSSSLASQQPGNKSQRPFIRTFSLGTRIDEYIRIGTGNQLVRDSTKLKRIIASEKVRWSLHTARLRLAQKRQYCLFFTRFGKCKNVGGKCPFIHDTSKVAICTKFLKGQCSDSNCKLTHKVIPERMQDCSYFLKGLCTIENCPYRHVKVNANAPLCDGFLRGHCYDGDECHKKHSYTCPLFEATGKCPQGNLCKLRHPKVHSKSRKRKQAKLQSSSQGRYFCSTVEKTGEPMRVLSDEVLKGVDDIFFSDGKYTEYISLDVYSDTACIENKTAMELDSKYSDLKSLDIDELKPVRIMNMEELTIF